MARPSEGETAGLRRASEDQRPIPQVSARRGLKLAAAIAGIGIVGYAAIRVLAVDDQPKFGRLDGSTLAIFNADGKELWRKTFPEGFSSDWYYGMDLATHIWFGDLEGTEEDMIHDGEERGVGTDARRQRQERGQCEDLVPPEDAQRETEVVH